MKGNLGNVTINNGGDFREYLCLLLKTLWVEGESFNSEIAIGGYGWQDEIVDNLTDAGYKFATMSAGGVDWEGVDGLVCRLIDEIFEAHRAATSESEEENHGQD